MKYVDESRGRALANKVQDMIETVPFSEEHLGVLEDVIDFLNCDEEDDDEEDDEEDD